MKKNFIGTIAIAFALLFALPANAQFKFGVKAGLNINKISFKTLGQNFSSDNQTGWFAGAFAEFKVPVIGIGVDAGLQYDYKGKFEMAAIEGNEVIASTKATMSYISIPINLKYTLGLGSAASVYVATGPQFSFNVGNKTLFESVGEIPGFKLKSTEFYWNVGAGVTFINHIRVGYTYNIALGQTADLKDWGATLHAFNAKNNTHQVSVAYIF